MSISVDVGTVVGECKFGAACKFSHLTPADKERLVAAGKSQVK